jgi:hypothetical protein
VIDGFNIVKGKVLGNPPLRKQDRADRIGRICPTSSWRKWTAGRRTPTGC